MFSLVAFGFNRKNRGASWQLFVGPERARRLAKDCNLELMCVAVVILRFIFLGLLLRL